MNAGAQCKSDNEELGDFTSIDECAGACKQKDGCNFFIFGTESKSGHCLWEKTPDRNCPEGWLDDEYYFYEMKGSILVNYKLQ